MLTPYNLAPAGALIAPIDYPILVSVKRMLVKQSVEEATFYE
jgi:hypothetical protein